MNINCIGTRKSSTTGENIYQYDVTSAGLLYRIDYYGDSNPRGRDLIFQYWDEISLIGIYERENIFAYDCDTNTLKRKIYHAIDNLLETVDLSLLSCDRY